jgi:hypothetical protein
MLGPETIRNMSDVAAWRAAEEGKEPLIVWQAEDLRHAPFLGDYIPAGWRRARWDEGIPKPQRWVYAINYDEACVEVDASGFGASDEPALTWDELATYATTVQAATALDVGWALIEVGQLQAVLGIFVRDASAPAKGLPSEEDVTCEYCGTVHDALEECDEEGYDERHEPDYQEDDDLVFSHAPGQLGAFDDSFNVEGQPEFNGAFR